MRKTLLFFLFAIVVFQLEAQNHRNNSTWIELNQHDLTPGTFAKNELSVSKFKLFNFNKLQFTQSLQDLENSARNSSTPTILPFPSAEGHLHRFQVKLANTLHPELAKKFPDIKTYEGVGLDDPTATIRFEVTSKGLTGMIFSAKGGTQVIQSVKENNQTDQYLVYYKKDASRSHKHHFNCQTDHVDQLDIADRILSSARDNDGLLRTYRLALAVTAEYTALNGGTKAGAMSAMATTINRVNGILKRDVGIELQMVANNDDIIFTNANNDGYSNNDSGEMLTENQTIIDSLIGNNNYDVGHVFATGNGGVAYLGSVCLSSVKAGGVTGSQIPSGDAFDVDYVAHEIGHQLGANHTQNNDCSSSFATSFEPGSGSTIMGYAGICFPNVQNNSDDYYHSISIDQIRGLTSSPNNCATTSPTSNARPTVNAGADYTIPHSTPFELEGVATDSDGDAMTYCWEQMNNQAATMPPLASSTSGPSFRSLSPSTSPVRQFPAPGSNKNHESNTWEVLPAVGRMMNFRVTVRDNFIGGGNTSTDDMKLTIAANAGPFEVMIPNGGESLSAGVQHNITWDVAGSNQAPVNATTVDIYLSTDGGNTYPIVLAENVPNDGSASISFQNSMVTSNARIKIKGHNNVFFDVSNSNFTITQSQPGFNLGISPATQVVCQGEMAVLAIDVASVEGYSGNVDLSVNLPNALLNAGTTHNFQATTVSTGNSSNLTINLSSTAPPGNYEIQILGASGDLTQNKTINLTVAPSTAPAVNLTTPANNEVEVATTPTFSWTPITGVTAYNLQIASDGNFSNILYTESNLTSTDYTLPLSLENGQVYHWRVQSSNECGLGSFSNSRSFTVTNDLCFTATNSQVYQIISESPNMVTSPILVSENGPIQSLSVSVDISHSWIGDLTVTLESPTGKRAILFKEICGNEDQVTLTFSSDGTGTVPCSPPVSDNEFPPMESFDIFNGEEANGTWNLIVSDAVELDGGNLNNWSLEVCRVVEESEPLSVLISNATNPNCNGANTGSIQATVVGGTPNYNISWSNGANQLVLNDLAAGTYNVVVTDADGTMATATATLTEPTPIVIEDVVQNVACNGGNTGSIQVFPSGGTPSYQYTWANGVRQFDNVNLPDGNYEVTVADQNGCTASKTFTVTEPTPIELSFTSNNALDGVNGSVDLAVTGGTGDYTYEWSSGATTRDVDGLAPGNFSVIVTDQNGCAVTGDVSVITENTGQSCYNVSINITLDNYGEENRWELKDGNGEVIQSMGPFNNFENGSVQATNICLPPGCYDFTIFDLWGDGMCCSYGQGGYEIIEDETGIILASGGAFNKEETKNICIPTSGSNSTVLDYCGANGRNTQYEWIETVEIAGQIFNSGDNEGYGNFSETVVDAPIGGTLDLAFTPAFGFFEYHENWQVWVDFNADGDFEDEGEAVLLLSGNQRVTGTIGIPTNAVSGKTRMRIAMKWGALIDPCESFSWGEVEDYTLDLLPLASRGERPSLTTINRTFSTGSPSIFTNQIREKEVAIKLFPNPTAEFLGLEWEEQSGKIYELVVTNSLGQIQLTQIVNAQKGANKTKLNVQQLLPGNYSITLRSKDKVITKKFLVIE